MLRELSKYISKDGMGEEVVFSESPERTKVVGEIIEAKKIVNKSRMSVFENVTLISYGFGSLSSAIVIKGTVLRDVKCIIKLDECKSLTSVLKLLDTVMVKGAIVGDGFTRSRFPFPQGFPACVDHESLVSFKDLGKVVLFYTSDIYYGKDRNLEEVKIYGASCFGYSTSALYAFSTYCGVNALSLNVVSENITTREKAKSEEVEEWLTKLGIDVVERLKEVTC